MTKRVVEKGYQPFVVIRPENEASQSLYKKLGFWRLYQIVRMTFMPTAWQDDETETNRIMRENLENAVRQLTIEQKVVDALRSEEEISINEETIENKDETVESLNDEENIEMIVEEPEDKTEIIEEGERIDITELSTEEGTEVAPEDEGGNDDGSNQDDGGTDAGDLDN